MEERTKQKVWSQITKAHRGENHENQQILDKLSSEEYCAQFNRVMEKLKSYEKSSKLSDEEKEIISAAYNILIIGRSGTGKTTTAILRMFATDVVFKKLRKISMYREGLADTDLLTIEDINKKEEVHQVFITVNPILTREVNRLYQNLCQHLKCSIKRVKFEEIKENDDLLESIIQIDEDQDVDLPKSFLEITDEHFPAFIPVFNFLTRVDATLNSPFFAQGEENTEGYFGYHQKKKGMKMRFIETPNGPELKPTFNIDFNYFKDHFWPRQRIYIGLSAIIVWTEISSAIKGSADAYKSTEGYISKDAYLNLGKKQSQVTDFAKREKIYDIFIQYEAWKEKHNAYDFQDLVNYVLRCVNNEGYYGSPIHFTFIDEVQDCSTNFLLLMLKITRLRLFFAGDTAQSITRGAGFRFCDLNSLFLDANIMTHSQPIVKHLSVNFRSHARILDVANLLIRLLVSFFPNSIDRLDKETSKTTGEKPIIVKSISGIEVCFNKSSNKRSSHIEFGWNQAILVRNSESRKKLPSFLRGAICLTILESKGLEFNDVILYNFFTDSEVDESEWGRLAETDPNEIKKMREGMKKSLLCSELKHLYVGITRARKRLIFFDEDDSCRASFEKHLLAENLVRVAHFISWQDIVGFQDEQGKDTNQWKKQGLKLYKQGNYELAKLCFENAGDEIFAKQAQAKMYAEEGKKVRLEISALEEEAKEMGIKLTKSQKESNKKRIQGTFIKFKTAAELFKASGDIKEAAECYSSAEEYSSAAELYIKLNMCKEAGLAFYKLKLYKEAETLFQYTQEYVLHIKCCIFSGQYKKATELFQKNCPSIQLNDAKLLMQSIIRGSVSGYLPEPFVEKRKDNPKIDSLYDEFNLPDQKFENYLSMSRHLDEFIELSRSFQASQLSANNMLDPNGLFIILKRVAMLIQNIQQRVEKNSLHNAIGIDFIKTCQPDLPDFFNLFSVKFGLEPLAPLSLLLDSFAGFHTRICMIIANTLRFADLSCWFFASFIFKLSRPFTSHKNFKIGSCMRYRTALTALRFLDEEFYEREILGYSLTISGFWKTLKIIPENRCENLIKLYFLDCKEYNKFNQIKYFKNLKPLKILEQLMIIANSKINFTLTVNSTDSSFSPGDYFLFIQDIVRFILGKEPKIHDNKIDKIKSLFYGPDNIFDSFKLNDPIWSLKAAESCVVLSLLLMSSKEIPLNLIKLHLNVAEMEAFIFAAENIIKLLLETDNVINPQLRSLILEYILIPFGINIVTPGKYTRLLPFSTHVVMSRMYNRSHLILGKDDKRIYSLDIEGNYWLVPKDIIFKDIAKSILHRLSELIYERSQYKNYDEFGREIELKVSPYPLRKLEKKIEYRICIVGEIYMLNKIISIFNSRGREIYASKFGNRTSFVFIKNFESNLGNLPFPCINITNSCKIALEEKAKEILNSNIVACKAFMQLRTALLFLLLVGKEINYSNFLEDTIAKNANDIQTIINIYNLGSLLHDLYHHAQKGNPKETCQAIYTLLTDYNEFIPPLEISNLFKMYCAYALLTCTYSFIPIKFEKNFYYCYPIKVFKELNYRIKKPQSLQTEILNIDLIEKLIKLYRGDEHSLSNFDIEKKFILNMFKESLTVIINSTRSEEYFIKLTDLDLNHKASIYPDEDYLRKIFADGNFGDEELKYLYNESCEIIEFKQSVRLAYKIGKDLLHLCDYGLKENIPIDTFEFFPKGNFNQYHKNRIFIEDKLNDTLDISKHILIKKANPKTFDIITIQNIIKNINDADEVFNITYGNSFLEEQYSDWIWEGINKLAQDCILQDQEVQEKIFQSKQNFNHDDEESSESDGEEIYSEEKIIKASIFDPIDEVTFDESNVKLDEGIEEEII